MTRKRKLDGLYDAGYAAGKAGKPCIAPDGLRECVERGTWETGWRAGWRENPESKSRQPVPVVSVDKA